MTSTRNSLLDKYRRVSFIRGCCLFLCGVLLAWCQAGIASESLQIPGVSANSAEAWLVTFNPGDIYWERFGHNAIWLREPAMDLDHTFNFGFFDFDQEDFFLRFIRGRMLYFSIAQPASREFEFYRQDNRSIRVQKLNLTALQYQQLRDYLLNEIRLVNRDYRYDYYMNNCSTRIRDALDIALDGALAARTKSEPATLNFRDQTRRLTQMQYGYYLGLELSLGLPVDQTVTRWDEMFIPMVVADELSAMSLEPGESPELLVGPLVGLDLMLFTGSLLLPADIPATVWHFYLLAGLLMTGIAWLSGKFMPPAWLDGLCHVWVLINATAGLLLAFLWLFTDHEAARPNANLLLVNPLILLVMVQAMRRFMAVLLAAGTVICYLLLLLPEHQYNLDLLVLLTPVNLAVAAYFFKPKPDDPTF
jgi:hypothetical protein